jgi:hypothetical protein
VSYAAPWRLCRPVAWRPARRASSPNATPWWCERTRRRQSPDQGRERTLEGGAAVLGRPLPTRPPPGAPGREHRPEAAIRRWPPDRSSPPGEAPAGVRDADPDRAGRAHDAHAHRSPGIRPACRTALVTSSVSSASSRSVYPKPLPRLEGRAGTAGERVATDAVGAPVPAALRVEHLRRRADDLIVHQDGGAAHWAAPESKPRRHGAGGTRAGHGHRLPGNASRSARLRAGRPPVSVG